MNAPLDFESEDPILSCPNPVQKRGEKTIGLDDLLNDYYQEKIKVTERELKRTKVRRNTHFDHYDDDDDDDDDGREALFSKTIDECHNQMKRIGGEEQTSTWGINVFANQRRPEPPVLPDIGQCSFLQSFMDNELNSLVGLAAENGDNFMEGLLLNGWLTKVVYAQGHLEQSLANWSFYLIMYSSSKNLSTSACEFWCSCLSSLNKTDKIRIDWFPGYPELKLALETYGFLFDFSCQTNSIHIGSDDKVPPKNIRAWIKFVTASCFVRNAKPIFSVSEVEELAGVIICLTLDRRLQSFLGLLDECLQSLIGYFTTEEWDASCNNIARSLASRIPMDFNCLHFVESIPVVNSYTFHLRSAISYHLLLVFLLNKATCEEEILNFLIAINVKDKECDLFKLYIYLVLTENWLLDNRMLKDKLVMSEMLGVFLRNCSCHISSSDMRPYASKVRTKASYLLHCSSKSQLNEG